MKPYSNDLRQRVVDVYESGEESLRSISERFVVGLSFVRNVIKRYRETGRVDPKPHSGGRQPLIDDEGLEILRTVLSSDPGLTLKELQKKFHDQTGKLVSEPTIWRALCQIDHSCKKKTFKPEEGDREDVKQEREDFEEAMPTVDGNLLIVLDEQPPGHPLPQQFSVAELDTLIKLERIFTFVNSRLATAHEGASGK